MLSHLIVNSRNVTCMVTLASHLFLPPSCCSTVRLLPCNGFRQLLQPLLQLQGEFLVALLTHWLHVKLHKLVPVEERVTITGWKLRHRHSQYVHAYLHQCYVYCEKRFSHLLVRSFTLETDNHTFHILTIPQQHINWNADMHDIMKKNRSKVNIVDGNFFIAIWTELYFCCNAKCCLNLNWLCPCLLYTQTGKK